MKHTKYGNYEKPLYEFQDEYCRRNGIIKSAFTWDLIPFDLIKVYAAMDACVTFLIFEIFRDAIKKNNKLKRVYKDILIPGMQFLKDIQDTGVPFDRRRLEVAQNLMEDEIQKSISNLYEYPEVKIFEKGQGKEFNPNSTLQLRKLLFDNIGLKPTGKKTGTGQHSTDAEVLLELGKQHDIPQHILDIRQKSKIKNTYLDKIIPQLDRDSRLRTNFNLHSTTSGRLSSSGKLNMQQIPRDNPIIKGCIKAKENHEIIAMDLTTAEVYVAAVLSKDKALQDVFRSGGNFHSSIAKLVFRLPGPVEEIADKFSMKRQAAKAVTFGIMYGAGPYKISQQVTKDSGSYFSMDEAKEVIDDYFKQFKRLKLWLEQCKIDIERDAFTYSLLGRKRRLENVKSEDKGIASHEVRSGINFLVQSLASDINLLGAIDMNDYIKEQGMKSRIFALVHDSILAEVPYFEVDHYKEKLQQFVQKDRGCSIKEFPIGCEFDVGQDYSFGKFEKLYKAS
jgi:DNA polymerase I-like protein with 3'-5' exonuclease and polymerase domains